MDYHPLLPKDLVLATPIPTPSRVNLLRPQRSPGREIFPEVDGVVLDLPLGTPIQAIADGRVLSEQPLTLLHANNLVSRYAQVGGLSVSAGDQVLCGAPLGKAIASPLRFEFGLSLVATHTDPAHFMALDGLALLAQVGVIAPPQLSDCLWRGPVPLAVVPLFLQQAIITVEDRRFYQHHGLDFPGMGRALIANLRAKRIVSGASTITQQAARSALQITRRSLARKIVELPLALMLERFLTKEAILELYFNAIYWGRGATTVAAAAVEFFGKPLWALNLKECAVLAGLPNHPQGWGLTATDAARIEHKTQTVLSLMHQNGVIDDTVFRLASEQPYTLLVNQ